MQLPDALKRLRKTYRVTQKEAASILEISERTYQYYEYGKLEPSIKALIALADHFDVSLDYLCGRSDDPTHR